MTRYRFSAAAAAALLLLSGCLPYSCRREESAALMPADSLSREMAAAVPMDTLELVWTRQGGDRRDFVRPRTVRFGAGRTDTIYVSDAEHGLLFTFGTTGTFLREIETTSVPYLAGVRHDTVAVFDPGELAIHLIVDGEPVDTVSIADDARPKTALVYGAFGGGIYYKRVDSDAESFIAEVGRDGAVRARHRLAGPHWRHAGLLRMWGDSLLSLSGFRPVVDIVTKAERVDTLALKGFDSPMLSRSRSFMIGDVHEAPLLSSSAAASGDLLFVLNMRPGWLRLDAFDRSGRLVHRLTERDRAYRSAYFPQDLDVRRRADDTYAFAVVFSDPEPSLRLYSWRP